MRYATPEIPSPPPALGRAGAHMFVLPWDATHLGGVTQVVTNLYRTFQAAGIDPLILVSSWEHPRAFAKVEQGRRIVYLRLSAPCSACQPVALAKWMLRLLPEVLRLRRELRRYDVRSVNVHYPSLSALHFLLARVGRAGRSNLVLSFHGLDIAAAHESHGLERWLWRVLLRRADRVVACSQSLAATVADFDTTVRPRLESVHNGVDIAHLVRSRNEGAHLPAALRGRRFVLCVATYERKKGLDVLLRAFRAVLSVDATLMLALVGSDHGAESELRALAQQLGIVDSVAFCGLVAHADLHAYYEAASVFCLPSRAEPFGIVLLEAAAFRCPVVATSVGGIPEIVEDGVSGRLVRADDPASLSSAIVEVLLDPALAGRLTDALHQRVQRDFSWQRACRSYLDFVERDSVPDQPRARAVSEQSFAKRS